MSFSIQGPLVYINYARVEDLEFVTTNLSLNLSNYVCIARYGGIFRGDKVMPNSTRGMAIIIQLVMCVCVCACVRLVDGR